MTTRLDLREEVCKSECMTRSEEMLRTDATITRNEDDGLAVGTYSVTIAATRVVNGIDLDIDNLDIQPYLRNPVVLLHHGYAESTLPIARTTRLLREDGKLRAHFIFNESDPMARRVREAWDGGFINAASIGWRVDEQGAADGRPRQRMTEWSIVPVPADIEAIRGELMEKQETAVTREEVDGMKNELTEALATLKELKAFASALADAKEKETEPEPEPERTETIPADKLATVAAGLGVKETDGLSVRQILDAAIGAEMPAGDFTDEALWGMAVAIHARRERAKADALSMNATSSTTNTLRGWTAQNIIDMEAE